MTYESAYAMLAADIELAELMYEDAVLDCDIQAMQAVYLELSRLYKLRQLVDQLTSYEATTPNSGFIDHGPKGINLQAL